MEPVGSTLKIAHNQSAGRHICAVKNINVQQMWRGLNCGHSRPLKLPVQCALWQYLLLSSAGVDAAMIGNGKSNRSLLHSVKI